MYEFVEPRVRRLVADRLGVPLENFGSAVSLRDDLAANALELVELALALEGEFAIVVSQRVLDEVRTYGDLVHATGLLIRARRTVETNDSGTPARVRVRVVPPGDDARDTFEWSGWLTPYAAEMIADDTARAGRGTRVEVTLAPPFDRA